MICGIYFTLFLTTISCIFINITGGTCVYPDLWQSSEWYDSYKGVLTFTTDQMTGWTVNAYSSSVTSWSCFMIEGDFIVSKSDTTIDLFGSPQDAYLCMQVTKLTDVSYYYYAYGDKQVNADQERVYVVGQNTTLSSVQTVCSVSSSIPTEEFHVLVRKENVTDAKSYCPTPLLGSFAYTYNAGGSDLCGAGTVWDVCTDRTTMTFNYTQCTTTIAYSSEGQVFCVMSLTVGDTYYVSMINPGSVDNTNTYRFTCMAVAYSGSSVLASQNPSECVENQSPQTAPTNGAKLTLTPYVTCPFETSTPTEGSVATGAIIGAVVAVVLIAAGVVLGYCIYKKKCKGNKVQMYDGEKKEGTTEYLSRGYTIVENGTDKPGIVQNTNNL